MVFRLQRIWSSRFLCIISWMTFTRIIGGMQSLPNVLSLKLLLFYTFFSEKPCYLGCIYPYLIETFITCRYVKSRNDAQLRDKSKATDFTNCDPEAKTVDGKPIVPCGLIAWSLFNDTYKLIHNNVTLRVEKKDISWKSDRDHKFGSDVFPTNFQKGPLKGGKTLDPSIPVCSWILLCIIQFYA